MGRPLPGFDVVLLDDEDREVGEGELALRLAERPAGLMLGYATGSGGLLPVLGKIRRAELRSAEMTRRDGEGSSHEFREDQFEELGSGGS